MSPDAAAWTAFFAAQVGASAALSGLVIVAISINLKQILETPQLPARAAEALVMLVGSMVLSSVALMPASPTTIGTGCLLVAALVWTTCVGIQTRAFSTSRMGPFAFRVALGQLTAVPMIVGSAMLMAGTAGGFFWLAAGTLLAVVTGVLATWVLLVEILR